MQKHIRENGNVIYSYDSLESILDNSDINFIGSNNILFLSSNLRLCNSKITFNNNNSIGFIENNKNDNINYDIVITSIHESTSELLNNLLKKGIIIEGFKNLKIQDQINIYYQAIQKPIGKYQINKNKILEMINTN